MSQRRGLAGVMPLSKKIDAFTAWIGQKVAWLILLAILIAACNAIVRKLFSISSNGWLEVQWYLFGAAFLLSAAKVMASDRHVRIDLIFKTISKRNRLRIDLVGHVLFLLPLCGLMLFNGIPFAATSFSTGEYSINPGGLILWPAKILVPLGFALLLLQTASQIIKCWNELKGLNDHSNHSPGSERTPSRETGCKSFFSRHALVLASLLLALVLIASLVRGLTVDPDFKTWTIHNLAPIMFCALIVGLLSGYPIAFSLGAVGLLFGLVGIELDLFQSNFLQAIPDRVYGTMSNETLLAIPFFTFMGLLLERTGLAEDLLNTIGQLFGPWRGGLAFAVIFVGALLAATTGIVAASVISMGLISLPIMQRYGYGQQTATGVIIASGTLAQIIPPSLVLIIMADQLGVSVGQMYRAALAPGLLLIAMFALYIFILTIVSPRTTPALPVSARGEQAGTTSLVAVLLISAALIAAVMKLMPAEQEEAAMVTAGATGVVFAVAIALINRFTTINLVSKLTENIILVLVPPLALIFLVLGTILIGMATPTEGGALGAVGTLILALLTKKLSWQKLKDTVQNTAELSTFVLFILIGARVFSLTFYGVDGHIWIEELLLGLPGGTTGFLIFVSALIFVLGFVLDFYEIAFILLPLLIIPAQALGIDLVWFGILIGINLQTSFMSPPFGFSLFFLKSVAPAKPYIDKVTGAAIQAISTATIYRGVIPFIAIHLLLLVLVARFPEIITVFEREAVQLDEGTVDDMLNSLPSFGGTELAPLNFD